MFEIAIFLSVAAALGLWYGVGGAENLALLWLLPVGFIVSFAILFLAAGTFLYLSVCFTDMSKPQEHASKYHRFLANIYAPAITKVLLMRMRTKNLDLVPKNGRFLLVCNHLSDLDPVVLMAYFGKYELSFISKWENSSMFIVGKLMHKLNCQLINRENDREALKTILNCIRLIKEDESSVAVFPEGYTSVNGRLQPLRAGCLKIATKAQVPLVVCTLAGTEHVFRNIRHLKPTTVRLQVEEVIYPEAYKGTTAVELSGRVYQDMLAGLGPDYAPLPKEAQA